MSSKEILSSRSFTSKTRVSLVELWEGPSSSSVNSWSFIISPYVREKRWGISYYLCSWECHPHDLNFTEVQTLIAYWELLVSTYEFGKEINCLLDDVSIKYTCLKSSSLVCSHGKADLQSHRSGKRVKPAWAILQKKELNSGGPSCEEIKIIAKPYCICFFAHLFVERGPAR